MSPQVSAAPVSFPAKSFRKPEKIVSSFAYHTPLLTTSAVLLSERTPALTSD